MLIIVIAVSAVIALWP